MAPPTREWTVAGAVLERDDELLLVCNRRRNGSLDWSKQFGGVDGLSSGAGIAVDSSGSSVLDALFSSMPCARFSSARTSWLLVLSSSATL